MLTERKCSMCGLGKPLTEFHRDQSKSGGRGYRCKDCQSKYGAARYNTPQGRLRHMAKNVISRTNNCPGYRHIECLVGSTVEEVYRYLASHFLADTAALMAMGEIPSVDRIDPQGHYEHGNIRVISKRENDRRAGLTAKMNLGHPIYVIWPDGRRDLHGSMSEAAKQLGANIAVIQRSLRSGKMSKKFGCRIVRVGGGTM